MAGSHWESTYDDSGLGPARRDSLDGYDELGYEEAATFRPRSADRYESGGLDGFASPWLGRSRLLRRNPSFKPKEHVSQRNAHRSGWLIRALRQWKPFSKKDDRPESDLTPDGEIIPADTASLEPATRSSETDIGHNLILAITGGKGKSQIRSLLAELRDPNAKPLHPVYGSVLAAAAGAGSVETIRYLLNAGADADMQLITGKYGSALCAAAASQHSDNLKAILMAGVDVDMYLIGGEYGSALAAAAREGSNKNVRLLLQAGAEVNMILKTGLYGSALCAAVPSPQNLQSLLDAGANVEEQVYIGPYGSALAAAAGSQFPKSLASILEAGAKVNRLLGVGDFGSAVIAAAAAPDESSSTMNIKTLIKAGADLNTQTPGGLHSSALAAAASRSNPAPQVIEILVKAGADVNMQLHYGVYGSALAAATSVKAVEALLKVGADVDMKLTHGCFDTALAAALQRVTDSLIGASKKNTEEEDIAGILLATGVTDVGPLHQLSIGALSMSNPVTRRSYDEAREFKFDWELPLILEFSSDIEPDLLHRGTLTRNRNTVKLASCHDFLSNSFGDIGTRLLHGIMRALRVSRGLYSQHEISVSTLRNDFNDECSVSLNKLAPFNSFFSSAECWYPLFDSAVIALQSSVEPQLQPCEGLELDFKQLLKLTAVEYPIMVDDGIILMGYSTALVPIKQTRDGRIMWHLETATDDFQLQASDLQSTQKQWLRLSSFEDLLSATVILGWSSKAEVLLGTNRLVPSVTWSNAKVKTATWHWSGANLQFMAQTASPLKLGAQMGMMFDRSVNTIQFSPSTNYLKCLSSSSQQPIILYDVKTKRAWLVPLLSVFHHMLLAYYKTIDKRSRANLPPFAEPTSDSHCPSWAALHDQGELILEKSTGNELTVRDLIMGFSVNLSKTTIQPPRASNMHPLTVSSIFGYEFADIVMDSPSSELKKTSLEKEGLAWIPLLSNIKCLFCSDLGDAIIGRRSPWESSPCNSLLEGYDLMAASIESMELLAKRHGSNARVSSCQLSNNHSWCLAGTPFQTCEHEEKESCWDRPGFLEETLQEIKSQQVSVNGPVQNGNSNCSTTITQGALVFGGQAKARSKTKTFLTLVQSTESRKVSIQSATSLVS
ncbi:hypothetical protein N7508_000673 [Penicillium antarcticum]|uniref:uncharacterized protein n=1 Tax=Penicillium antarcticum TaxID=416450 RepID=UPI00239A9D35|nr:uncharacterized protein N7508_000673 [Penicillium antarcticum]KAJ5320390.1 hypothetical protein N7508_000673 [Penicillium antarcticum]